MLNSTLLSRNRYRSDLNYAPRERGMNAHLEQIGDDPVEGRNNGSNEGGERAEEGLDTADDNTDGLEDVAELNAEGDGCQ